MENNTTRTIAKRGYIYKWREGMPDERNVLVIGSNIRGNERLISVLMFGDSPAGKDVVRIENDLLGDNCYLHCGMVTYVNRLEMAENPFGKINSKKAAQIDRQLCIRFGITNEDVLAELRFYKRKFNELIEQVINNGLSIDL